MASGRLQFFLLVSYTAVLSVTVGVWFYAHLLGAAPPEPPTLPVALGITVVLGLPMYFHIRLTKTIVPLVAAVPAAVLVGIQIGFWATCAALTFFQCFDSRVNTF